MNDVEEMDSKETFTFHISDQHIPSKKTFQNKKRKKEVLTECYYDANEYVHLSIEFT